MVVWAVISWNSLGPIVALHRKINRKDYLNILGYYAHPMEDTAPTHTAHAAKNWFEENESELEHME